MELTIKTIFDKHSLLKADTQFVRQIIDFDVRFVTKNADHVDFFGSGLLGVHPVRWLTDDRNRWMDDVVQVDELSLELDIHALKTVDVKFKVASDVCNQSFIYVLYRILNSSKISHSMKKQGIESVIRIMHYKFIGSIMANTFRYPADEGVARATYQSLSMQFALKRAGSWGAFFLERSENITNPKALHYRTFQTCMGDAEVLYAITDIQTRIRQVVKDMVAVFYKVKDSNGKIHTVSSMMQTDEGVAIKDVKRSFNQFHTYINQVIPDRKDFFRNELFQVILQLNPSADEKLSKEALLFLSENYMEKKSKGLKEMVSDTLLYGLEFMRSKRIKTNDLKTILVKLRAMFIGSRVNDPAVLKIRDQADSIIRTITTRGSNVPTSPERTVVLLYLFLRSLTKDHYKN